MTSGPAPDARRLNDGTTIPAIGFGTYPLRGPEGVAAMVSAIECGYRLLDTAVNYDNERDVAEALRRSGIDRGNVYLTTKVPGRFHRRELALGSIRDSAVALGVSQLDLVLIHWPNPSQGHYLQAWQALVEARALGLTRSIGVSNFAPEHLERIIDDTGVVPAVNQIELHPYFPQAEARRLHERLGIVTESWSPLGKRNPAYAAPAVAGPAAAYGVSPAQVILRWHLQLGAIPLPKSATPARQRENLDVFSFHLTDEQVRAITALSRPDGRLFGGDPRTHEEM